MAQFSSEMIWIQIKTPQSLRVFDNMHSITPKLLIELGSYFHSRVSLPFSNILQLTSDSG